MFNTIAKHPNNDSDFVSHSQASGLIMDMIYMVVTHDIRFFSILKHLPTKHSIHDKQKTAFNPIKKFMVRQTN